MYDFFDYETGEKLATMVEGSYTQALEEMKRLEDEYDIAVRMVEY